MIKQHELDPLISFVEEVSLDNNYIRIRLKNDFKFDVVKALEYFAFGITRAWEGEDVIMEGILIDKEIAEYLGKGKKALKYIK